MHIQMHDTKDIYINNIYLMFGFLAFVFLRTHEADDGVIIMILLGTISNRDYYIVIDFWYDRKKGEKALFVVFD